jgi:hypothetical protein
MTRDDTRALQLALLAQGYRLPRWGADGHLGGETLAAVDRWAADHDRCQLTSDSAPSEWRTLLVGLILAGAGRTPAPVPSGLIDAREPWLLPSLSGGHPRRQQRGVIPWPRVATLVLHQMDCRGDTNPGWLRWSRGDLAIHYVACRDGSAAWLYDCNALLWHAHGYNGWSIGLEVEGRFPGLLGVPDPHRADRLTDDQADAALRCVRHAVAEVASHGGTLRYLAAHRQSCELSKRPDPGEEIWRRVALPAMAEHSLLAARTLPEGAPIPEAWDPRAVGVRY